jgi:hypothetical protein
MQADDEIGKSYQAFEEANQAVPCRLQVSLNPRA